MFIISGVPQAMKLKEVISTLDVPHLFHWSIVVFQRNPEHNDTFDRFGAFQNSVEVSVGAVAFLNIHERPLPLAPSHSSFTSFFMC
jgi:hypothetical protein